MAAFDATGAIGAGVPIGYPIANTRIHLLDKVVFAVDELTGLITATARDPLLQALGHAVPFKSMAVRRWKCGGPCGLVQPNCQLAGDGER